MCDECRKAADQGHPHASYNVALGHIKGIRTDLLKTGYVSSLHLIDIILIILLSVLDL